MGIERCDGCDIALDPRLHARCDVCGGALFCLACARSHLCSSQCSERRCLPGLCVRAVRDGKVSEDFGVQGDDDVGEAPGES